MQLETNQVDKSSDTSLELDVRARLSEDSIAERRFGERPKAPEKQNSRNLLGSDSNAREESSVSKSEQGKNSNLIGIDKGSIPEESDSTIDLFDPRFNSIEPKPEAEKDLFEPRFNKIEPTPEGEKDLFDPKYNKIPEVKNGENNLFPREYNELNDSEKSALLPLKGIAREFVDGDEKGTLYIDQSSGHILGMVFDKGSRAGQRYVFERDAQGRIEKIQTSRQEAGDKSRDIQTLIRTSNGWQSDSTQSKPLGLKSSLQENGVITGDFSVNDKGDIQWESADKSTKEIMRLNGRRDLFDMKDYSRKQEFPDGKSVHDFWDGYQWRQGEKQQLDGNRVKVVFRSEAGKPVSTIRNWQNNGFEVDFGPGRTKFQVDSWNSGKMNRTHAGKEETLYNSGVRGESEKQIWMKGQETRRGQILDVKFTADASRSQQVSNSELPAKATIDQSNGKITGLYANGAKIHTNVAGRAEALEYPDGQTAKLIYDINGQITKIQYSSGLVITRINQTDRNISGISEQAKSKTTNVESGQLSKNEKWIIESTGKTNEIMEGTLRIGAGGILQIRAAGKTLFQAGAETVSTESQEIRGNSTYQQGERSCIPSGARQDIHPSCRSISNNTKVRDNSHNGTGYYSQREMNDRFPFLRANERNIQRFRNVRNIRFR